MKSIIFETKEPVPFSVRLRGLQAKRLSRIGGPVLRSKVSLLRGAPPQPRADQGPGTPPALLQMRQRTGDGQRSDRHGKIHLTVFSLLQEYSDRIQLVFMAYDLFKKGTDNITIGCLSEAVSALQSCYQVIKGPFFEGPHGPRDARS